MRIASLATTQKWLIHTFIKRLVASIYYEVSSDETGWFPCFRSSAAAGTRARAKLCFHLLFSSVRGKVLLALELLGVALYFVSLGPSHQRRYGCYVPISCGLRGRYRFTNITCNINYTARSIRGRAVFALASKRRTRSIRGGGLFGGRELFEEIGYLTIFKISALVDILYVCKHVRIRMCIIINNACKELAI